MVKLLSLFITCIVASSFTPAICTAQQEGSEQLSHISKSIESDTQFEKSIRPLLETYCANCHAPGEMEGLDFLAAMTEADAKKHRGMFADVAEQMESLEMPPRNCDQPTEEERKLVVDWIKQTMELKPADTERIAQYVVEVFEDKKGNLWFGTMSKGAARYDGKSLTWFSEKDGLPSNTVSSFAEDKTGNIWAGTHNGVGKFDGMKFGRVGTAEGIPMPRGRSPMSWAGVSADSKGRIWISVAGKLFHEGGDFFKEFKTPIAPENISSFAILAGDVSLALEDKAGNKWFSTDGDGAYKFDGKAFTHYTKKDGLCSNNVNSIVEDNDGNIWFACMQSYQPKMTRDGGLCRFDGTEFKRFPNIKGLSENDLYTVYKTRSGDLWVGAPGVGAYRYDGQTFTLFDKTDKPHRTRNFGVQDILETRNGTLWFGFSGGLFRFDGQSFFNITKDGPWKDLTSTMAEAIAGKPGNAEWIHTEAAKALSLMAQGKFDQATAIFQKLKAAEPKEQTIQERNLNQLGYHFVFDRKLDLAIELFKLNTILYPEVSNTFDSLGEAYWRKGDESLAVKHFKKAIELDPENSTSKDAIQKIAARQRYEKILVAPKDWMEEVIIVPPSFAPTMSLVGLEHLRLPPEFRDPDSDWFMSYLFAIELTEPATLSEEIIGDQALLYFQGLAKPRDDNGIKIETDKFTIAPQKLDKPLEDGEYTYLLTWKEPFVKRTALTQNLRIKLITNKNQNGVLFICGSPQPFDSDVWKELIRIRSKFEASGASPTPSLEEN